MNERKIEEYTVLRGVVTVLVVIGHSIVIKSATQYGGYDYSVIGSTNRLCLKLFMIRLLDIESSRYTFKPLFFIILQLFSRCCSPRCFFVNVFHRIVLFKRLTKTIFCHTIRTT